MNIYIGNLSFDTDEEALRQAFAKHGDVTSVNIITDRHSGRSRGFGFVEMSSDSDARNAINALNGQDLDNRTLTVNEARPRTENRGGGGNRNRRY